MTGRTILSAGTAIGAMLFASSAMAHPVGDRTMDDRADAIVEGALDDATVADGRIESYDDRDARRIDRRQPYLRAPIVSGGNGPMGPYVGHAYPMTHGYDYQPAAFDRDGWLDACEYRVGGGEPRRDRNGNIIGGLLGAVAGGFIGDGIAEAGDKLGGALIGAGVGGLAGLAIGAAIDAGSDDDRDDARAYCEDYLANYMRQGPAYGADYRQHYYHGQPMMMVPVMIEVPRRAVVREYVTEETVDVEVVTYENAPRRRVIRQAPAPRPSKPVPAKRVRSIKGR